MPTGLQPCTQPLGHPSPPLAQGKFLTRLKRASSRSLYEGLGHRKLRVPLSIEKARRSMPLAAKSSAPTRRCAAMARWGFIPVIRGYVSSTFSLAPWARFLASRRVWRAAPTARRKRRPYLGAPRGDRRLANPRRLVRRITLTTDATDALAAMLAPLTDSRRADLPRQPWPTATRLPPCAEGAVHQGVVLTVAPLSSLTTDRNCWPGRRRRRRVCYWASIRSPTRAMSAPFCAARRPLASTV